MLDSNINLFLLGKHLKILDTKSYRSGQLWEVVKTSPISCCLKCGSVNTVKAGKCTSTVREESIKAQPLWLKIHKHRIYCKDCKKTINDFVSGIWPKRRSIQRFRKSVVSACRRMTDLSTVSRFYNISHGFAYQVYYEQVEVKIREYKSSMKWPVVIGIDEHFFRRQNKISEFVTMITD